ncbi:unnamed protein product, partial [Porites lobata]
LATLDVQSILEKPATDEINMEDRNHAEQWHVQHATQATFESCGTRTIKGEINLYIELQKH